MNIEGELADGSELDRDRKEVDEDSARFKVDYKKLGDELLHRIERDELYWKQNDAKLRAVTQAKCYEEFRQTVLAAHLTPMKSKEKDAYFSQTKNPALERVVWNATAGGTGTSNSSKKNEETI